MQAAYEYFRWRELGLPDQIWAPFAQGQLPQVYPAGSILYVQGTEAQQFYYLVKGRVKAYLSSEEGEERILTVYRAGDILGEASFFDELPRVSSAVALSRCELVSIGRQQVQEVFTQYPELAMAMLKYLARTVRMLSGHMDDISFSSADRRLARLLLSLSREQTGPLRCTHEELGASIGASRVTVSRVLNRFSQRGWLAIGYRTITLLDRQALEQFLSA